jgi:hypothetical protein
MSARPAAPSPTVRPTMMVSPGWAVERKTTCSAGAWPMAVTETMTGCPRCLRRRVARTPKDLRLTRFGSNEIRVTYVVWDWVAGRHRLEGEAGPLRSFFSRFTGSFFAILLAQTGDLDCCRTPETIHFSQVDGTELVSFALKQNKCLMKSNA